MVLIISKNTDKSSNVIIDWLLYYKIKFIRLSANNKLNLKFLNNNIYLEQCNDSISLDEVKGVFNRGAWFNFNNPSKNSYFKNEFIHLKEYVIFSLNKKTNVFLNNSNINKLIVINIAKDCGLNIPDHNIIETKKDLEKLLTQNIKLCTKSICGINTIMYKKYFKSLYTIKLEADSLKKNVFNKFYPSLIQKYIDKLFEVRSFVLNDRIFSMAIFSQKQTDANHDYRKGYSNVRTCSIKLPKEIEIKIIKLLNELKLRSGSIDLIYSKSKEFYFLEVNPSGQFNFLSEACNYNIENEIVKLFLN